MPNEKLRRRLAFDAARLIYQRHETDPYRAVLRAAGKAFRGWLKPDEFPSEAEIRFHLQQLSWMQEGDARFDNLREVRLTALQLMRRLAAFRPRAVGSVVSGDLRRLREIRLYVFADDPGDPARALAADGGEWSLDERSVVRRGRRKPVFEFCCPGTTDLRVTCYPEEFAGQTLKSTTTGRRIPQASLAGLERLFRREYPEAEGAAQVFVGTARVVDRFEVYRMLLGPLASVE